ncbi:hypothetical protein AMTRI_Chr01g109610 [Amborella trichopoda]
MAKLARAVMAAASRAASSLNINNHYLLQLLQSEIEYELSKHPSQAPGGLFGDFVVEWDDPKSEDLLLRRRNGSEEDVAVSSLLGPEGCRGDGTLLDMKASMKVCIAKPSLSSVLQFDCSIYGEGDESSDFSINNVHYLPSVTHMRAEDYKGPSFRLNSSWEKLSKNALSQVFDDLFD